MFDKKFALYYKFTYTQQPEEVTFMVLDEQAIRTTGAIALAAIALVAIAFGLMATIKSYRVRRDYRKLRAEKTPVLEGLIGRMMAGDVAAYEEVTDYNLRSEFPWHRFVWHDRELSDRYHAAMRHIEEIINFNRVSSEASKLWEAYRKSTTTTQALDLLVRLHNSLSEAMQENIGEVHAELGVSASGLMAELNRTIRARYDELLKLARNASGEDAQTALLLLSALIHDTQFSLHHHNSAGNQFAGLKVAKLARPDDWNKLVVALVENPALSQFEHRDMARGDVLHLAAGAERSRNLVDMLLALAFHFADEPGVSELPDEMVASLIRKVIEVRAETTATQA